MQTLNIDTWVAQYACARGQQLAARPYINIILAASYCCSFKASTSAACSFSPTPGLTANTPYQPADSPTLHSISASASSACFASTIT